MATIAEITEGFAFAGLDGKIMAWYEGMPEAREIARRGGHHNWVSALAFDGHNLYDATIDGAVFETLENKQIFASEQAVHHLEWVDGALVAMLGNINYYKKILGDPVRELSLVHVRTGEVIGGYDIKDTESTRMDTNEFTRKGDLTAHAVPGGWDVAGYLLYTINTVRERGIKLASTCSWERAKLVRGKSGSFMAFYDKGEGAVALVGFPSSGPERIKCSFRIPDLERQIMGKVLLAVQANNQLYVGMSEADHPTKDSRHALYVGASTITGQFEADSTLRRLDVENFHPLPTNNAAAVLPKDYIDSCVRKVE